MAHAMAEAAGASDISNLHGLQTTVALLESAVRLLGPPAKHGEIMWHTWFRLAASAIPGNCTIQQMRGHSMSVGAYFFGRWLHKDRSGVLMMDSDMKLPESWGVKRLTGSLQGLEAEAAVIKSQCSSMGHSTSLPLPRPIFCGNDEEDMQVETAIFSHTGGFYRIMSIRRRKSTLRILNPIDVYCGAILAERPRCTHDTAEDIMVHAWFLGDILQGWNGKRPPLSENPHIALLERDLTNQNVPIGFAAGACALKSEQCYSRCLAKIAKEIKLYGISCEISK